jgi:hypothetical protein
MSNASNSIPKPPLPKRTTSNSLTPNSLIPDQVKERLSNASISSASSSHSNGSFNSSGSDELLEKLSEIVLEKSLTIRKFPKTFTPDENIIKLNIGGTHFATLLQTLDKSIPRLDDKKYQYPPNLFQEILHGLAPLRYDENRAIFIDRNPHHFNYVLDFLRHVDSTSPLKLPNNNELLKSIFEEAQFYKVEALKDKIYTMCMNSGILSESQTAILFRICKLRAQKWNLIYKATRDGFHASSFHNACAAAGTTIVLVKTSLNFIFGGCTLASWDYLKGQTYREDPNAFIFSLANRLNRPVRINVTDSKKAIKVKHDYGPVFGDDDFALFSPSGTFYMSETDNTCYSSLGKSYKLSAEFLKDIKQEDFLAGDMYFKPVEVEVFEIAKQ